MKKRFYEKIFHPAFVQTYEYLDFDISLSTFKKIWKNFLIENALYESDLGAFGVCKICLRCKREARSSMLSDKSTESFLEWQDHLEQIRICRYCLKVLEIFAEENPDQALFLQLDRQDQQTTALPFFYPYVPSEKVVCASVCL